MEFILLVHKEIKLEINDKKIPRESSSNWKLNNIFQNHLQVRKKPKGKLKKHFKLNENTTHKTLWDAAEEALAEKFTALNGSMSKAERLPSTGSGSS